MDEVKVSSKTLTFGIATGMSVERHRTDGYSYIEAIYQGMKIRFDAKDSYEGDAKQFAEWILAACNNPCSLD